MPHELSTEEVEGLVAKHVIGATISKYAGADGVELHAAHGYLINQFLSPFSNKEQINMEIASKNVCVLSKKSL